MNRLYYILIIFGLISILITLSYSVSGGNLVVVLLPLTYVFVSFLFKGLYWYLSKSFVFKVFQLQAIVRYLLLPVLYSSGQNLGVGHNSEYTNIAIVIMCIELLVIYTVFLFYAKKQQAVILSGDLNIRYIKKSILVPLFLVVLFIIVYSGGALDKVNFIWELSGYVEKYINQSEELEVEGLSVVFFNTFKVILTLYLFSLIQQSKFIVNKKWFICFIILASSLVMVGLSRFSMVLNLAVLLAMLSFMLNNSDVKRILYLTIPFFITVLGVASIAKFSRYGEEVDGKDLVSASSLNAYFLGFGNIAVGIEAFNTIDWLDSVLYLFNDTLQNVPILSKLTDDTYKTTLRFNETYYGHKLWADQIVPLSISGIFHFGYIGIFIYNPLFIAFALLMERCAYMVDYIGYKYVFIYFSLVFSLVFMLNLGSFYGSFARILLFVLIPIVCLKFFTSLKFSMR